MQAVPSGKENGIFKSVPFLNIVPGTKSQIGNDDPLFRSPMTGHQDTTGEQAAMATAAPSQDEISSAPTIATRAVNVAEVDVAGNHLRLFVELPPMIESLIADIRTATKRVWIESYIVADDAAGRAVAEALRERVAAGVESRLVYDSVGSLRTPSKYFADLEAAGVLVHPYHHLSALWGRFDFFRRFNRRSHRKLVVIDDEISYFGGMNLIDSSGPPAIADKSNRPPEGLGWRDVHVRLTGPKTAEIAVAMEDLWRRINDAPKQDDRRWPVIPMAECHSDDIFFFDSRPTHQYRKPSRVLKALLDGAQKRVTLLMAYFIPVGKILKAMLGARKRGVTVQVIVPGVSDVPMVQWASRYMYEMLLKRGIEIYERNDRMLHSKAMVVDSCWSVIGSCNLDPRSLRINLEFLAVIRSSKLAAELEKICTYEREHSRKIVLDEHLKSSWWDRMLYRFAWYFRHGL
jgi:cardiolipin synthase